MNSKVGSRRGTALTEVGILLSFALVGALGLVWLYGDDIRALVASAGNSLAGLDSTPATRTARPPDSGWTD